MTDSPEGAPALFGGAAVAVAAVVVVAMVGAAAVRCDNRAESGAAALPARGGGPLNDDVGWRASRCLPVEAVLERAEYEPPALLMPAKRSLCEALGKAKLGRVAALGECVFDHWRRCQPADCWEA
eukprot:CAMPEP_0180527436 /NCGR_PEP_ID=MMETSP1036_2-20121128/60232_1 /TAXON_ID=632150 /ORGANISM="Azadinium spinosum, Strain 3D9" /LENGTH=124 /DNA_ID=CAMNT_0022540865 /DNA_START=28 /DNA_END=399 /DNA_ORIENTATION=-